MCLKNYPNSNIYHLSENHGQTRLSHQSRFAAHIGTSQNHQIIPLPAAAGVGASHDNIIGYEITAECLRETRVATISDVYERLCPSLHQHNLRPTHLMLGILDVHGQTHQHVKNGEALDGATPQHVVVVELLEQTFH